VTTSAAPARLDGWAAALAAARELAPAPAARAAALRLDPEAGGRW
jgi:hypothetical protein